MKSILSAEEVLAVGMKSVPILKESDGEWGQILEELIGGVVLKGTNCSIRAACLVQLFNLSQNSVRLSQRLCCRGCVDAFAVNWSTISFKRLC